MHKYFLISAFLLSTLSAIAQYNSDSITIYKVPFGLHKFEHKGRLVGIDGLIDILEDEPQALKYIKQARVSYNASIVCVSAGTFLLIAIPITWDFTYEIDWRFVYASGGFLVASIPLYFNSNRCVLKGVNIHNSSIADIPLKKPYDINLGLTRNGAGIIVSF
ncbi:MAG: hypothetical protein JXB49_11225 [Bacteroidales bacterium]|nr:hypothetical protein [Bacteroidales bacterium]